MTKALKILLVATIPWLIAVLIYYFGAQVFEFAMKKSAEQRAIKELCLEKCAPFYGQIKGETLQESRCVCSLTEINKGKVQDEAK